MNKPRLLYQESDPRVPLCFRNILIGSALSFLCFFSFNYLFAQNLPAGFSQVMVANGISNPTVMAVAPDGRLFVAQQNGQLRVIKNGSLLSQPFVSLSVHSSGERGLLGIAFDPNFNSNRYVYLYYTVSSGAYNRISRFTANGDVAVAGSEQIILNLDPLSGATNHNGGNMQFGPDGKLYVGIGENADAAQAQDLDTYHGKLLRINPDGSVPPGNPFTSGSNQRMRTWAYGLRNPYTLAFQPGTGRLFVNDVGGSTWEEINDATTSGKNFGWPYAEGGGSSYSNPIYAYGHGSSVGSGCAITGGTFFNPSSTNYPTTYNGRYFFLDFCGDWIDMLTINGGSASRSNFASNIAGSPVSLVTGTDGNLYFLSRSNSAVYKIVYSGGASAPVITNQPQSMTVPQGNNATFSVSATGTGPLSYQWRKNGSNISGATGASYTISSVTAASAGTFSVVVSNGGGSVTSNNATLTVVSPNQPPTASITSPASGTTYAAGNVISFSGTATDPEDGNLGANAYNWYVLFYHDTHNHPGPSVTSNGSTGSFTIPTSGETATNVFYRLFLVVTDPDGFRDTVYRDIMPRTSTITINTNPQGLGITLDGQPFTAPLTVSSVEGVQRQIGTNSPQSLNGSTYNFNNWSNGGAQTQTISTPVNNTAYTANFAGATVAPAITSQPQSVAAEEGNSATFSVAASGTAPLSYQWRRNGVNISGATGASYTIASVTEANEGTYSVVVRNSTGSATSSGATLTVTSGSPGDGTRFTFFTDADIPASPRSNDGQGIALGLRFRSTINGFITGVRYYKGPNTDGTRVGHLWSNTGTMLASVTFTNETASGWQEALFSNPVPITAGVSYVASYFSPSGYFASSGPYFTETVVKGPLQALGNGVDGPNGLYRYTATPAFPTNGYNSSNYWVDVVFTTGAATDQTPPVVQSVTPANGATGVNTAASIVVQFNEALSSATVNGSNFILRQGANTIASNVSGSGSQVTIVPQAPLTASTVYTVTINGGASGVEDAAGNTMANDYTWSFTTNGGAPGTSYTIFGPADSPQEPRVNDNQGMGIVLGVRFRSSQNGSITGIRYYKGAGTTGTHVGSLWSNTGTLLATATFTNETSSGWQQVLFSNPVSISAGTTYVASCFSSSGDYAATDPYFTQPVINGPLRALADGEDGRSGVFRYTATPVFPIYGFNASNYWVDVVFTPGAASRDIAPTEQPIITTLPDKQPVNRLPAKTTIAEEMTEEPGVTVLPNPSNSQFNVFIRAKAQQPVTLKVYELSGKVIERHERIPANSNMRIGQNWRAGSYFVEIIQGNQRKFVKVIKVN